MNPGLKPAFIHSNAGACESLPSLSLGKQRQPFLWASPKFPLKFQSGGGDAPAQEGGDSTLSPMSLKGERGWKRETLRVTLAGLVQ